jgi:RNA polymerase sigma factor (sigma-70 family)
VGAVVAARPAANPEFEAYLDSRSPDLRDELVLRHMGLVSSIARHFAFDPNMRDDLTQVGYIGLIKAVEQFDPTLGVPFEAYARRIISGEISHYLRDLAPTIKVPRWYRALSRRLHESRDRLIARFQREPTVAELAHDMNITDDGIREILRLRDAFNMLSISPGDAQTSMEVRADLIKSQRHESFKLPVEDRIVLDMAIDKLAEFERRIVYLFFYMDLTQTEIAKRLGSTQRQISRALARSVSKIRKEID